MSYNEVKVKKNNQNPIFGLFIGLGIIFLVIVFSSFTTVESGFVGIKSTMGKFNDKELKPGLHVMLPFFQKIIKVDTKIHTFDYKGRGTKRYSKRSGIFEYPLIQVLDQRGLPIQVELTIQYKLLPDMAAETIEAWGLNWEEKSLNPIVRSVVRDIIGNYPAELIPTSRQKIAVAMENDIRQKIGQIKNQPISILGVQLRNVYLPPAIAKKIEEVQQAKQEAEKMKYEEEKAKKEQEVKLIKAETIKQEQIKKAEGEKISNELLTKSINQTLIKWKQIDVQLKMADAIKSNPNITILMGMDNKSLNLWSDIPRKR